MKQYELMFNEDRTIGLKHIKDFLPCSHLEDFELPGYIASMLEIENYPVEHAYVLGTDTFNQPKALMEVSVGDHLHCQMNKNPIASFLLLSGSRNFYLFHNHPDAPNAQPSNDDAQCLPIFSLIGNLLDITFKGSIILSQKSWSSADKWVEYPYI